MIPERGPEKWPPLPRKAAGAQIAPSEIQEAVTRNSEAGGYAFSHCNEREVNVRARNNWRASEVPAAAVIPSPRAYTKVAAVKKLVVCGWVWGSWGFCGSGAGCILCAGPCRHASAGPCPQRGAAARVLKWMRGVPPTITLTK